MALNKLRNQKMYIFNNHISEKLLSAEVTAHPRLDFHNFLHVLLNVHLKLKIEIGINLLDHLKTD